MQAIHETGSRLTHDVKNLLQSLGSLCAAVESGEEGDPAALRRLILRQLPQINRRLHGTLDKLARNSDGTPELGDAAQWWRDLQQRFAHEGIEFEGARIDPDTRIPLELFDRVAENCLQNALEKRRQGKTGAISVRFESEPARLQVCDAGTPLSGHMAGTLFAAPVSSQQGLGVGLYQVARQAHALGYELRLVGNEVGRVCFELAAEDEDVKADDLPTPSG
jgi:signal transduction histidine kinase